MKDIVRSLKAQRKAAAAQLRLLDATLVKFGAGTARRKQAKRRPSVETVAKRKARAMGVDSPTLARKKPGPKAKAKAPQGQTAQDLLDAKRRKRLALEGTSDIEGAD